MPDKLNIAESNLRNAMISHYAVYGSGNDYRSLYSNYPTEFHNMSHNQILEVADAVWNQSIVRKDSKTTTLLQPLMATSRVLLVEGQINDYVSKLGTTTFSIEDIKSALLFGKYNL